MDILILVILILLNGVFAMAEIALVTARRSRLARLAEEGDPGAAMAVELGEEPTRFLSTVQIGITAIGILNGIVGEAALADDFARWLQAWGLSAAASGPLATTLVVVLVTYFTIVIGELVPKRIGQFNAEGIARRLARPINLLSLISRPFVYLLTLSTDGLLRLLGKRELSSDSLTEDDIHDVLRAGSEAGVIEKHEHDMVRNVFKLDDRQILSLMTPRHEIVYVDLSQAPEENLQYLLATEHSRFPVCHGGLDDLRGIISAKRLLRQVLEKGGVRDFEERLQPAVFVPETLTGMQLLTQFRESGVQMVFVVDEYGEVQGLVTLQNVLEALAGEFRPRDPEDLWAVPRDDGSWLLDGLMPLPELKDLLGLKSVPEEEKGRYHTLSGMLLLLFGNLPRTGDHCEWEQWRFEVMDLDRHRVDKVLASPRAEEEASAQSGH